MLQVLINNRVDEFVIGGTNEELPKLTWTGEDPYSALVRKFNPEVKISNMGGLHHLGHAASAFYGSGFETAAAVVVDGAGSYHKDVIDSTGRTVGGYETETIYQCSYPHEFNAMYKRYGDGAAIYWNNGIQEFDNSVTITKAYEAVSYYLGFGFIEAGKTMGLAPYGEEDRNIPPFFVEGRGNKNLLLPYYPAGAVIDEDRYSYLKRYIEPAVWHRDFSQVRDIDKNLAWHVQRDTEEMMYGLIQRAIDTTGETNIVISGGYGLNCVANYKYLKRFPGIKFWIDPISHDGGTAIGLARHAWYKYSSSRDMDPTTTVYLSTPPDYNQLDMAAEQIKQMTVQDANPDSVADLLVAGKIVALFSGKSEGGPRALGNRSLLFDPRRHDGKNIINSVKQREWFRPFAGSVLQEYAQEWFDLAGQKDSPYMMYAVDVLPAVIDRIPAVCHVDGTCRVQTVTEEQNPHYYKLIDAFRSKTGIPLLMNTSLNLAGQPLVETVFDAVATLFNSNIEYVYFPDIGKIISKQ
jgi:carbamoyltransferase